MKPRDLSASLYPVHELVQIYLRKILSLFHVQGRLRTVLVLVLSFIVSLIFVKLWQSLITKNTYAKGHGG